MRKLFELLNRINHTPSQSHNGMDAKVFHKESLNVVLTKENGKTKKY
jgi:hypothetical protein